MENKKCNILLFRKLVNDGKIQSLIFLMIKNPSKPKSFGS